MAFIIASLSSSSSSSFLLFYLGRKVRFQLQINVKHSYKNYNEKYFFLKGISSILFFCTII
jgi:hypothetical protein